MSNLTFLNFTNWAVIGVSSNTAKYGYKVYKRLKSKGYNTFGVNPTLNTIDGDQCYANLREIPTKPDVVITIVPPNITEHIINECIELEINKVWMQPGSESEKAILNAKNNGIHVIHHDCVLIATQE